MNTLELAREASEAAAQRRAHLSVRAVLAGVVRLGACTTRLAFRLRAGLDPRGGAYDGQLARA
ncbi:MAG: hypothetical protein H6719_05020 [Sandaracinaceae bacterium]|nr:hypothetical protein [Sandaracinaceae bacterium]